jgi:hypothetical protein
MGRLFTDLRFVHLHFNPAPYYRNDILDLLVVQVLFFGNMVSFCKTAAAACGRCVLGYKDGMARKRCLPAIIFGLCGRQTLFYKLAGMGDNYFYTLVLKILLLLRPQPESTAKFRLRQNIKNFINITHNCGL